MSSIEKLDPLRVLPPAWLKFRLPQSLWDARFARLKQSMG